MDALESQIAAFIVPCRILSRCIPAVVGVSAAGEALRVRLTGSASGLLQQRAGGLMAKKTAAKSAKKGTARKRSTAKRELITPRTDKRFVKRTAKSRSAKKK